MNSLREKMKERYGSCSCGEGLTPVWFEEDEIIYRGGGRIVTGRTRKACSHLECRNCFKNYCVDDSFDGKWS